MTDTNVFQTLAKKPLPVCLALALFMVLSRPYPMTAIIHLADASNAIFFFGGLLLLPGWMFLFLLVLTILIDYVAISYFGTSAFCISPAYVFQWPAFAALWFGGRLLVRGSGSFIHALRILVGFVVLQALAFALTSVSFYYLSGRFVNPDIAGMLERTSTYFPGYLMGSFWYVLVFLVALQALRVLSVRDSSVHQ